MQREKIVMHPGHIEFAKANGFVIELDGKQCLVTPYIGPFEIVVSEPIPQHVK